MMSLKSSLDFFSKNFVFLIFGPSIRGSTIDMPSSRSLEKTSKPELHSVLDPSV